MTAFTPGQWEGDGGWAEESSSVAAAVLFYPPVDIAATRPYAGEMINQVIDAFFGDEIDEASPSNHVRPGLPPVLTLTGAADGLIRVPPVQEFHAALDAAGVENELIVYPGLDHGFDIFGPDWEPSAVAMHAFFDRVLQHP
jgi:acetyl esterase/lipase